MSKSHFAPVQELITPQAEAGGGPPVIPSDPLMRIGRDPSGERPDFRHIFAAIYSGILDPERLSPRDPGQIHPLVVAHSILNDLYCSPAGLHPNAFQIDTCPDFIRTRFYETYDMYSSLCPQILERVVIDYKKNLTFLRIKNGKEAAQRTLFKTEQLHVSPLGGLIVSKFYFVPRDHLLMVLSHDPKYNTGILMCGETDFSGNSPSFRPISAFYSYVEGQVATAVVSTRAWDGEASASFTVFTEQGQISFKKLRHRLDVLDWHVRGLSGFDYCQVAQN